VTALSYPVPAEPLWDVFTPTVVTKLRRVTTPSPALSFRLRVLAAEGPNPDQSLRAHKSAWEVYLLAAFACALFEGEHGTDLRARLTGIDDDNFRSALNECLTAWYLAGHLNLRIEPRPEGRSDHPLEFAIMLPEGDIKVEVKSPFRPITSDFWWGDDADLLESALQEANKQFQSGDRNLLVIVPCLRLPIFDVGYRTPIERAFIGETVIGIPIDTRTGGPAGPESLVFKEKGRFTKGWSSEGVSKPRFTRVGAALFLNEYVDGNEIRHRALIVHNPNAHVTLPRDPWLGVPEFYNDGGRWRWSDVCERG
jgi:hypothetical protein